jgi:hypothetical protein
LVKLNYGIRQLGKLCKTAQDSHNFRVKRALSEENDVHALVMLLLEERAFAAVR